MEFSRKIISKILNLIIPEDRNLARLLELEPRRLRMILPRAEPIKDPLTLPLFNYRNKDVRTLVWAVKYKVNVEAVERIANFMYEEILEIAQDKMLFEGKDKIILIPIPMNDGGRRKKGFNQTEELCEAISKQSGQVIKVDNILEKIRETKHQTSLRRRERLNNMRGSIQLRQGYAGQVRLKNALLIIIDDVYTTGATINEARRALGDRDILAITIAH